MDFIKKAASATAAAAKSAADATKAKVAELRSYPTQVRCSACPTEIPVPPTAFDWTCAAGHTSQLHEPTCRECKAAQPAGLPRPTVTCPSCQAVTVVPTSNARKHVGETAVKTKEFAVATAASTKQGIEHLRAAPTTFHCAHCNTLLAVPTGPWACQTCTSENEESEIKCKQCGQKKSDQKAICGVCRQSTVIPASNFTDSIKSNAKSAAQGTKKVYYDVSSKPYVTCGKCATHVTIEKKDVAPVSGKAAPVVEGEGVRSAPAAAAGSAPASGNVSPSSAAQQAGEGVFVGSTVICPSCKNPIEGPTAAAQTVA